MPTAAPSRSLRSLNSTWSRKLLGVALPARLAIVVVVLFPSSIFAVPLDVPPAARQGLEQLYAGDPDAAVITFRQLQRDDTASPLGYLLEADALWWKIYCVSCEVKWGMIDAWKRPRQPGDEAYLALTDTAIRLAESRLARSDSAEMRLYAGIGYLLRGRLLGLRDDRRGTARAGLRAREHLLRAIQLDSSLADAYTGLGLYNYYVDTLSTIAKILRFFMGIPGGDKKEGVRQLEIAMRSGALTDVEARFYLAKNLRNYDQKYQRAIAVLKPLVDKYPRNPIFHLVLGDLYAKLGRNETAAASFRAAQKLTVPDAACAARVQQLAQSALQALHATAPNTPNTRAATSSGEN